MLRRVLWKAVRPFWTHTNFINMAMRDDHGKRVAMIFIKGKSHNFTRDYYQALANFLHNKEDDVVFEGHSLICHMGNTSFSVKVQLKNAETGSLYGNMEILYVRVATDNRRPLHFSKLFKDKYKDAVGDEKVYIWELRNTPGDDEMSWHNIHIVSNHIDFNGHTNIKYYEQFVLDGIKKAIATGHIQHMEEVPVKSMLLGFRGESRLGDDLTVGCWQSIEDRGVMYAVINKGNQAIVVAKLELYKCKQPAAQL